MARQAGVSFSRHWEIYPDARLGIGKRGAARRPRTHRNEFPAGYSSASCTPALLASAWPAALILRQKTQPVELLSADGNLCAFSVSQPRGALHL